MIDHRRARGRANGEGSIYPYKNGYAASVAERTVVDGRNLLLYVPENRRYLTLETCSDLRGPYWI